MGRNRWVSLPLYPSYAMISAQHPRMHPPVWVFLPDLLRRALRLGGVFVDCKTCRARTRHPRQPGSIGGVERRKHLADHGLDARGRHLEVVRIFSERLDPVFEGGTVCRPSRRLQNVSDADQQFATAQTERG